jgi:hypothetical protein
MFFVFPLLGASAWLFLAGKAGNKAADVVLSVATDSLSYPDIPLWRGSFPPDPDTRRAFVRVCRAFRSAGVDSPEPHLAAIGVWRLSGGRVCAVAQYGGQLLASVTDSGVRNDLLVVIDAAVAAGLRPPQCPCASCAKA